MLFRTVRYILPAALLLAAPGSFAASVRVPINLTGEHLNRVLEQRAFTAENDSAVPWNDGTGCNYLILTNPRISIVDGVIKMVAEGEARVGRPISESRCLNFLDWKGFLQTTHEPKIDDDGKRVRFEVTDSSLLDANMKERLASKTVWKWVRRHAHPELEKISLDLTAVIQDVRLLIPDFVKGVEAAPMQKMLESMRLDRIRYGANTVITDLVIDVEDPDPSAVVEPEPRLSADELSDWQERWQAWDSFVTYTIKEAATASTSTDLRQELLSVMLLARYELDRMLAEPVDPNRDPLRDLFIQSWDRLSPLLQRVSHKVPSRSALQLFGFIAAGDALTALDRLGPSTGLELSVDGLRRLARLLSDRDVDLTNQIGSGVDPDLRKLFNFGAPLIPTEELPDVKPPQGWLDLLIPPAYADFAVDRLLAARLNKLIATPKNARMYVPLVRQLLDQVYADTMRNFELDAQFHQIVRPMLLATAWQESCYRQHVRKDGKIVPLRSRAGAVGLMQVRPSIWRGFYEPRLLRGDIGYNARAGAEILLHYMRDYAIAKGEHKREGGLENLVRATYATYNGGPAHLKRYRRNTTRGSLRAIDKAYWKKYSIIAGGTDSGPLACFGLKP